jgi:m7GpppX diphosphatase
VLEDDYFVMAPDLKWNGEGTDNLYLQAVIRRRDIRSVRWVSFIVRLGGICSSVSICKYFRDLTADELPMLEAIRDKCSAAIEDKYGLKKTQLKMFLHYQPTYYHLHVHIVNIIYDAPGLGFTSIPLDIVIDNLR